MKIACIHVIFYLMNHISIALTLVIKFNVLASNYISYYVTIILGPLVKAVQLHTILHSGKVTG